MDKNVKIFALVGAFATLMISVVSIIAIIREASWASTGIIIGIIAATITIILPVAQSISLRLSHKGTKSTEAVVEIQGKETLINSASSLTIGNQKPRDSDHVNEQTAILFVAADPTDTSRLRLGEEFREIQEKLKLAKLRDRFRLEIPQLSVRSADISQALLDVQPQIVHFSGHGTSTGALCFENQVGQTHLVQPDALAALFEQFANQVNCVLLNACYSEPQAKAIAEHIEYVIGMNQTIGDTAAIAFAIGFYQALGAGRSIEDAYKLGCVQIRLQGIPEQLTPILVKKEQIRSSNKAEPVREQSLKLEKKIERLLMQYPDIRNLNLDHPDSQQWRTTTHLYLQEVDQVLGSSNLAERYIYIAWHRPDQAADDSEEQKALYIRACDNTKGLLATALQLLRDKAEASQIRSQSRNAEMPYNTVFIRDLLTSAFNDEELQIFCFDHFLPVYEKFTGDMSRLWKIQLLIDHCMRHNQFEVLLARIAEANPDKFNEFSPRIRQIEPNPEPLSSSAKRKQIEIVLRGNFSNFTPEIQTAAVGAIAGLLNISRDEIRVLRVQEGSIILQVELPADAADLLVAMVESQDASIQELGISEARVVRKGLIQAIKSLLTPSNIHESEGWSDVELDIALEASFKRLGDNKEAKLVQEVRAIVENNRKQGRVKRFLENHPKLYSYDYVQLVAENYESLHVFMRKLQVERDENLWENLFQRLQRWAYTYLNRKGFSGTNKNLFQHATECATLAAIEILNARFPYDVDFDPWAMVLLFNTCQKYVRDFVSVDLKDAKLLNLDDETIQWLQMLRNTS